MNNEFKFGDAVMKVQFTKIILSSFSAIFAISTQVIASNLDDNANNSYSTLHSTTCDTTDNYSSQVNNNNSASATGNTSATISSDPYSSNNINSASATGNTVTTSSNQLSKAPSLYNDEEFDAAFDEAQAVRPAAFRNASAARNTFGGENAQANRCYSAAKDLLGIYLEDLNNISNSLDYRRDVVRNIIGDVRDKYVKKIRYDSEIAAAEQELAKLISEQSMANSSAREFAPPPLLSQNTNNQDIKYANFDVDQLVETLIPSADEKMTDEDVDTLRYWVGNGIASDEELILLGNKLDNIRKSVSQLQCLHNNNN